jgi:hypothetical protein
VFLVGYGLLLAAYGALLLPSGGAVTLVATLSFLGAYYACTDGVLMAIAGTELPEGVRATGMGLLVTAVGLARFAAAIAFGALWMIASLQIALFVFAGALAVALAFAGWRMPKDPVGAHA